MNENEKRRPATKLETTMGFLTWLVLMLWVIDGWVEEKRYIAAENKRQDIIWNLRPHD